MSDGGDQIFHVTDTLVQISSADAVFLHIRVCMAALGL
jgi:hypothetical protein